MKSKILVIEDNSNILEEVLIWLEMEGYEATGACNGNKGVQSALQELPDLILCDIMMPEKDGHRVLLELRANRKTALTPFIFITARQEKSDIRYGMELGADDYITKPFSREEFLGAIRSRLERRGLFTEHSQQQLQGLRDNLFRSLPHELRTPLVGILGVGELLAQDAYHLTPDEILDYAKMLTISGQHLYRLIENHLLYVQLEIKTRSTPATFTLGNIITVNPMQIVQDACNKIANLYNRPNDLRCDIEPGKLQIASEHLAKIISEIVDNAFKFSARSTLIKITSHQEVGNYFLTIQDAGHGIKSEDIPRISAYMQFERNKYEQRGAGLGLTIARLLAELYGGALHITSTPEAGTTVRVSLRTANL